jgi:hypothetical protein
MRQRSLQRLCLACCALLIALVPSGCGDARGQAVTTPPPAPTEGGDDRANAAREDDARAVLRDLQPQLEAWQALPPDQKDAKGRDFGPIFERALTQVQGTTSENKVLLWLADWRLHYQNGDGVLPLLNRLDALPTLRVKNFGERIRVEYLVQRGDLRKARTIAEALVAQIPEWSDLVALVALHERVGGAPPRTAGTNVSGGPADPATRTDSYLLYCIAPDLEPANLYWFECFLNEVGRPEYRGSVRVVLVTSDSTPLELAAKVRAEANGALCDVLWASPEDASGYEAWRAAWTLDPAQRAAVVLGPPPRRLILAVPVEPVQLRVLLPPSPPAGR